MLLKKTCFLRAGSLAHYTTCTILGATLILGVVTAFEFCRKRFEYCRAIVTVRTVTVLVLVAWADGDSGRKDVCYNLVITVDCQQLSCERLYVVVLHRHLWHLLLLAYDSFSMGHF